MIAGKIRKINICMSGMIIFLLLSVMCFVKVVRENNQASMPIPLEVQLEGKYSFDEKIWFPYEEDSRLSARNEKVVVKGKLNADIEDGAILNFLCDHIGASVYINGQLIYMDSQAECEELNMQLMPSMCSKRWVQLRCPEIKTDDEVMFRFINHHKFGNKSAYTSALSTMYITPDNNTILDIYLKPYIRPFQILGFISVIIAIMLLGATLPAVILNNAIADRLFRLGMIVLLVGGYILCDVATLSLSDDLEVVKTYGRQLCLMAAAAFLELLNKEQFCGVRKKIAAGVINLTILADIVILIIVIRGKVLIYDTQIWWILLQSIVCSVLLIFNFYELKNSKKESGAEKVEFILLLSALLIDMTGAGNGLYYFGIYFKLTFLVVMMLYMIRGVKYVLIEHQAAVKNEELQEELENSRIAVMLSQIQPHFLYNVIGTIRGLCRVDSEQAWRALGDFSNYLRGNMSALSNDSLIHFTSELRHIEAYLRLEKMRMGDELEIVYDINEKDFFIPQLIVQPIVENAVKHGLFEKEGGGTLILRSRRQEDKIIIEVIDDGIGFDINKPLEQDEHHIHVGLSNVR